jgi:hypothetical protein
MIKFLIFFNNKEKIIFTDNLSKLIKVNEYNKKKHTDFKVEINVMGT